MVVVGAVFTYCYILLVACSVCVDLCTYQVNILILMEGMLACNFYHCHVTPLVVVAHAITF
jgi:hypothetical protein